MLCTRLLRDLARLTRRAYHQTRSPIAATSAQPAIAVSDINQWLVRADQRPIENLSAVHISVNHVTPSTSIRPPAAINNAVIDPRANNLYDIENPLTHILNEIGDRPLPIGQDFELPAIANGIGSADKFARQNGRTTILIRRRKMRKHRLRKLRKRMKFEWAKKKLKRRMLKEKEFQAKLVGQIKEAEKFSAEAYVTEKLQKSKPLDLEQQQAHVPRIMISSR